MLLKLLLLLLLPHLTSNTSANGRYEWLPSQNKSKWYTQWERCILASKSKTYLKKIKNECLKELSGGEREESKAIFYCKAGEAFVADRNVLCRTSVLDPSMSARPHFLQAVRGYDDPSRHYLKEFFAALSEKQGSLLLLGAVVSFLQRTIEVGPVRPPD